MHASRSPTHKPDPDAGGGEHFEGEVVERVQLDAYCDGSDDRSDSRVATWAGGAFRQRGVIQPSARLWIGAQRRPHPRRRQQTALAGHLDLPYRGRRPDFGHGIGWIAVVRDVVTGTEPNPGRGHCALFGMAVDDAWNLSEQTVI